MTIRRDWKYVVWVRTEGGTNVHLGFCREEENHQRKRNGTVEGLAVDITPKQRLEIPPGTLLSTLPNLAPPLPHFDTSRGVEYLPTWISAVCTLSPAGPTTSHSRRLPPFIHNELLHSRGSPGRNISMFTPASSAPLCNIQVLLSAREWVITCSTPPPPSSLHTLSPLDARYSLAISAPAGPCSLVINHNGRLDELSIFFLRGPSSNYVPWTPFKWSEMMFWILSYSIYKELIIPRE